MKKSTSGKSTLTPFLPRAVLICLLWSVIVLGQSNEVEVKRQVAESNGKRVIQFSGFKGSFNFVWCGTEHLALDLHGQNGGIRLLNIATGKLRQITKDTYHGVMACTSDGKHIFFTDRRSHGRIDAVDVVTAKQEVVSAALPKGYLGIGEARDRISPAGRYVVGTDADKKSVGLSDRELRRVVLPPPANNEFANGIAWVNDDQLYLLITQGTSREKLMEIVAETSEHQIVEIPPVKGYSFGQIQWNRRSQELYLLGWPNSEDETPALFRFDPRRKKDPPQVVVRALDHYSLLPSGRIVYVRTIGVDYSQTDKAVISKDARRELVVKAASGEERMLMSVPYMTESIGAIMVSSSGQDIAFVAGPFHKDAELSISILNLKQ